jgi:membrane fusion protein (multidrug efflux system)
MNPPRRRLTRSSLLFAAGAGAVLGVALVLRWTAPAPGGAEDPGTSPPVASRPPVSVDAVRVAERPSLHEVEIAATFEARRQVVIGADVSGRVVELAVEENQGVEAGDPLVRLDPALAEVAVERARAVLESTIAVADLAKALHQRQRELKRQAVGSQTEFDQTLSEAARSTAAVSEARAALHEAETLLAKTVIRAPFSGVVTRFELEPGAYVRTGDAVAEMADLAEIEVAVGVDDRQIIALESERPVRVAADALPGEWFEGRIASLGRTPDAATQKYRVPVRVPNADMRLLPGMIGRVQLVLGDETPTIRVPRRAVRSEYELDFVWVLELAPESETEGGTEGLATEEQPVAVAHRRRVKSTPVPFRPDLADVSEGLVPGDIVAVSNLRELADGLSVQVTTLEGNVGGPTDETTLP